MEARELYQVLKHDMLHDRTNLAEDSPDSDYLWSPARLISYMNEAQRQFARRGLVIRDNTTEEVVQVQMEAGTRDYALHKSILAVVSAKYGDDTYDLARAGHAIFDAYRPADAGYLDPAVVAAIPDGKPIAFSTDETLAATAEGSVSRVVMRMYPKPSTDYDGIVHLRVIRLPLTPFTIEDIETHAPEVYPEIPEDHHLEMLDWAAYLALRIVDRELGDPKRAKEFKESFEENVKLARQSVLRKMFTPHGWGFGRNGWSWEG